MVKFVLPTLSFHQLFLVRLLLMVVMAAFLAHWKVVLQNFLTNFYVLGLFRLCSTQRKLMIG